jgi:ankyrin repeat protein
MLLLGRGADVEISRIHGDPLICYICASYVVREADSILSAILKAGARVDAACANGRTALIYAARSGSCSLLKTLLRAGASLDAADTEGGTALDHALAQGSSTAALALLTAGARPRPSAIADALRAIHAGRGAAPPHRFENVIPLLWALLAAKAPVDHADADGMTALHHEAAGGDVLGVVDTLLAAGAQEDALSMELGGCAALYMAARVGGTQAWYEP